MDRVYFVSDCVFYTSKVKKIISYVVFNVWMETRCLGYERCLKHEKRGKRGYFRRPCRGVPVRPIKWLYGAKNGHREHHLSRGPRNDTFFSG